MTFELFDERGLIMPSMRITRVPFVQADRVQRHSVIPRLGGILGQSILAIGGTLGGCTGAIALEAAAIPIASELTSEQNEPASLAVELIEAPPVSPALSLGSMLPSETIATVIVDTMGDWQGMNQFDLLAQPIEGLSVFPYIPSLTDSDIAATLGDWSGDQIALAWLPSDRAESGNYGITIAPFATDGTVAATQAQRYRDALAAEWSREGAVAETQTYRGIEILALYELPLEFDYGTPDFDFNVNNPSREAKSPQGQPATAVEQPTPIAPSAPVPIDQTVTDPTDLRFIRHAIAQLGDRLLFATSVEAITDYLDVLNLGDPLTVPPAPLPNNPQAPLTSSPDLNLNLPSEAIAVDPIDTATLDPLNPMVTPEEPSRLSDVPAFREAIAREPEGSAAIVYADVPHFLQALGSLPLFSTPLPDGTTLDPAETWEASNIKISTIDGFLWFDPSGARMQFRSHYIEPQPQIADLVRADNETLQHIPAASAMTLTARGLDIILPEILAVYDATPSLQEPLNQGREAIRNALGLDLDTDIVPLLDGDMSLFFFPVDPNVISSLTFAPLGVGMTIETSDRPKMEALLTQLETLWREQIHSQASPMKTSELTSIDVEGFEVTSWNVPSPLNEAMSLMGHTWVSDDTLLITSGTDLMANLLPTPYQSLLDSYTYQSAIAPLPQPNIGLLHINVGSILSLLNDYIPVSAIPPSGDQVDIARIVRAFRSISESTTATEHYAQDDIHIQLAPRRSN